MKKAMTEEEHGTYRAAVRHWHRGEPVCEPCGVAARRTRKRNRLRALAGKPATVPKLGARRRVQALMAIGWTYGQIAEESGVRYSTLRDLTRGRRMYWAMATAIAAAYDRLSDTPAPPGRNATYVITIAQRNGWPPPSAWFDIDDPNEQPDLGDDKHMSPTEKLAEFEWLTSLGVAEPEALMRVGWSRDAMEKHLERQKKEAA